MTTKTEIVSSFLSYSCFFILVFLLCPTVEWPKKDTFVALKNIPLQRLTEKLRTRVSAEKE